MKRAIVVFPEFADLQAIESIRHRFDPLAGFIPAHITLVFPFESELSTKHLETHIQQAVQGIPPFEVVLGEITGSEQEYLFLNVKQGNDLLIELHDRLYGGALEPFRSWEHTFVPHLTVGRLPDPAQWKRAIEELKFIKERFVSRVNGVSLYSIDKSRKVECKVGLIV